MTLFIVKQWLSPLLSCTKRLPAITCQQSGSLDLAVRDYVAWQKSRVSDKLQRREWNKARDIALERGYNLQLIVDDREKFETFLLSRDIRPGVSRRFGRDIQEWTSIDETKRPVTPIIDSEGSTAGTEADD